MGILQGGRGDYVLATGRDLQWPLKETQYLFAQIRDSLKPHNYLRSYALCLYKAAQQPKLHFWHHPSAVLFLFAENNLFRKCWCRTFKRLPRPCNLIGCEGQTTTCNQNNSDRQNWYRSKYLTITHCANGSIVAEWKKWQWKEFVNLYFYLF